MSRAHELAETLREAIADLYGCSDVAFKIAAKIARNETVAPLAELARLAGEADLREALAEALDLLDDTSHGLVNDGQQAWQEAYGRIHVAAGKPQRDEATTRPWIAALEAAE
ncbi:MAG: hypothetical protein ACJ780_28675 [Solirubrobacteraceae bacterium]